MNDNIRESRELAKQRKQERKAQAKQKAEQPQEKPNLPSTKPRSSGGRVDSPDIQLSKALAYILRHGAAKEFLPVRSDGYIRVDLVLARPRIQKIEMSGDGKEGHSPTLKDVQHVLATDTKKRYELAAGTADSPTDAGDVYWIRAVQGHSLSQVENLEHMQITPENVGQHLRTTSDPPVHFAVHGTTTEAWDKIVASGGLSSMGRNHIHLAIDRLGEGVVSGMRQSCTRFVYVDVSKALRDGVPFYISQNGVVLTQGVGDTKKLPLKYVLRTETAEGEIV